MGILHDARNTPTLARLVETALLHDVTNAIVARLHVVGSVDSADVSAAVLVEIEDCNTRLHVVTYPLNDEEVASTLAVVTRLLAVIRLLRVFVHKVLHAETIVVVIEFDDNPFMVDVYAALQDVK